MIDLPNPKEFNTHKIQLAAPIHSTKETESVSLQDVEEEFKAFEPVTFKRHHKELLELMPEWIYLNAHKTDVELFTSMLRYDTRNRTLVTGVYNNSDLEFKLISYKRRRFLGGKWITRKGTHPNNTPLIRVFTDDRPIYIIEGHHDTLTAILMGLDFIMIPTSGYKDAEPLRGVVTGSDIVFLVEDDKAYKSMLLLAKELSTVAKSIRLKQFSKEGKLDLSDYCFNCKDKEEVLHGL